MKRIQTKDANKVVKVHNDITAGSFNFTKCMFDILFYVLSDLKERERFYTVRAIDIMQITGREWNYQQLAQATEQLGSQMWKIETPKSNLQLWLFSSVEYKKGTGSFEVELSEKALPYLFQLKGNFTLMQLKSVLLCSSKFAKRFYMLACQWRSRGSVPTQTISELKTYLGLIDPKGKKPEQYQRWSDFKRNVLDIARIQINEHSDIKIDYKLTKRGRSYYWIEILINRQASSQLEIDYSKPIEDQKFFRTLVELYNIPPAYAMPIVKQGKPQFQKFYEKIYAKMKKGQSKKEEFVPYIIACYQNLGVIPKRIK